MVPSPQVCVSTLVTVSTMTVVDLYLLEQSMLGPRGGGGVPLGLPGSGSGPGVWQCAAVLLGDLGFLLALRFVSVGVAAEARSPRRGFASALWFLFLSLLQLKLFFVCQNYRQERRPPDPLARRTLTLLLSICLPSLFLVLTGADHVTPLRRKQEVRGRLLWVVVDLLDVLDLQAGLWEAQTGGAGPRGGGGERAGSATDLNLPLWAEGLVFFYCYALLLLLPCVALAELGGAAAAVGAPLPGTTVTGTGQRSVGVGSAGGGGGGVVGGGPPPRREALYPWLSLVAINLLTLGLRGTAMLWYRDPRISTVFLGKNLLALGVKISSAWERRTLGGGARGGRGGGRGRETVEEADLVGVAAALPSSDPLEGDRAQQGKASTGGGGGATVSARYHSLSRTHSHTHSLSRISLEHTDATLTPSFITHEL